MPIWLVSWHKTGTFFITIYDKFIELICAMKATVAKHDQKVSDISIYLQSLVQDVNYHCEFNIFFDNIDIKETAQVAALLEAAIHTLSARGAFFSHPYGP